MLPQLFDLVLVALILNIGIISFGSFVRGQDQKEQVRIISLIAYFVISLPLSYYLTFKVSEHTREDPINPQAGQTVEGMGLKGIWISICITYAF